MNWRSSGSKIFLIIAFSFLFLILESLIKYIFINKIPAGGFYFLFGLIQINFFTNTNIAFGLPLPQFLIIILIIIILIILSYLWYLALWQQKWLRLLAFSLIIMGALSNLLDRLFFGYVIDYINVFFWPIFNLADCAIVAGVLIYIIGEFKVKK